MPEKPVDRTKNMRAFVHNQNLEELTKLSVDVAKETVSLTTPMPRNFEEDTLTEFKQKKGKKVGTRRITIDIPEETHFQFKMLVLELGTDMNALLNRVVEKMVATRGS